MKYPQDFINKIINGDCLEIMPSIPDRSVDLIVTSPPYDKIRDYTGFTLNLNRIGVEIGRILKDGGICIMVIQDQTKNFKKSLTSFKIIVNWCENTDMNLFECCIYQRRGTPGNWWTKRFRVDHEYIPIFLKGKRPLYFDKRHMLIINPSAGLKIKGTTRATDGSLIKINTDTVGKDRMCCGTIIKYANSSRERPKDWNVKKQHPATFPNKLAEDFIKCFCPENGIVLDPMCGSGTTCKMAKRNSRNFIGIEISEKYCKIAESRILKENNLKRYLNEIRK